MEWRDKGTLLSVRKHGENAVIIEVFCEHHGRYLGVVRGGTSRKLTPILQPGTRLDLTWRARLEDHLGSFVVEADKSRTAIMSDRLALSGLNSITSVLSTALPEREPHHKLFQKTELLFDLLGVGEAWVTAYVKWELLVLDALGFGLDLTQCAVTGGVDDLCYVSPRSGRAVSREGAGDWASKLLPLPDLLTSAGDGAIDEIIAGLTTTGYFIEHRLTPSGTANKTLPHRARFMDLLRKKRHLKVT